MSWFHCLYSTPNLVLNLQKLQSFHSRMIELWNLIPSFVFLVPAWFFLSFMNSFWIKYWQRQGCTNPKVQAWGNVQDICCHDLCCCFVDFNTWIFRLHVPAGSSWTKTIWRTFCFPPSMASMDEVIHSAPWRPWMKSSIVPAALPPVWRPWMKSPAIVPAALSYLSFQAASRWTKTVIPNLWLCRTRGIWRGTVTDHNFGPDE